MSNCDGGGSGGDWGGADDKYEVCTVGFRCRNGHLTSTKTTQSTHANGQCHV